MELRLPWRTKGAGMQKSALMGIPFHLPSLRDTDDGDGISQSNDVTEETVVSRTRPLCGSIPQKLHEQLNLTFEM